MKNKFQYIAEKLAMNSTVSLHYPASPSNVNSEILEPSSAFRSEVVKVLWSIGVFVITYILLVAGAIVLAIACAAAGIWIISVFPKLFVIILGVGLIGLGIMVLVFLVKFIFSSNKVDRSHLTEIKPADHPLLFEFIRKLAGETQTPMPKRVYLSSDINACVFYDSSFWSMFFPVRKNLQIGLGLINCVNISEFKAIVAHEFGHFSQRSMKLGSYVYNFNKVIHNLLYENEGYGRSLESWANIHSYFSFFAMMTAGIVNGIQAILKIQYASINKRYLALSRQMEFHADAVAASVSGSRPLISSLRRLDVANDCYQQVLNYYNRMVGENRKAVNLFRDHAEMMSVYASRNNLPLEQGLVQVSADSFRHLPACRIMIKDQWASHPTTDDREAHLSQLNIHTEVLTVSAWSLFANAEQLQQDVTKTLYAGVNFANAPELVAPESFKTLYDDYLQKYSFDKGYKGFYDNRDITLFDIASETHQQCQFDSLDEILDSATLNLQPRIAVLGTEIRILENLQLHTSAVETFDFAGEKYTKQDAATLKKRIEAEMDVARKALEKADVDIFLLYCKNAGTDQAVSAYTEMQTVIKLSAEKTQTVDAILEEARQLYSDQLTDAVAISVSNNLMRKEQPVKQAIREVVNDAAYAEFLTSGDKDKLESYAKSDERFFSGNRLNAQAINSFVEAMSIYNFAVRERWFEMLKKSLAKQMDALR